MKKSLLMSCLLACAFAVPALEVDIYKSAGDPRTVTFTVPVSDKGPQHKIFTIERDGKKYYPQTLMISRYPNGAARWYRLTADLPEAGRYKVTPGGNPTSKDRVNMVKAVEKNAIYTNKLLTLSFQKESFAIKIKSADGEYLVHAPEITLIDGSKPKAKLDKVQPYELGGTMTGLEFQGTFENKNAPACFDGWRITMDNERNK